MVVFDISVVRALWETRVKKHKAWQKKEAERLEKSALEKYVFSVFALHCLQRIGRLQLCYGGGASPLRFLPVSDMCSLDFRICCPQ